MAEETTKGGQIFKNIAKSIKEFGDIQAERNKIKSSILINQLQAKQNMIYKLQEQKMKNDMMQQRFNQMLEMKKQQGVSTGSPMLEKIKNQRISDTISSIQQNNLKRDMISEAASAAKTIQGGRYGKLSREALRNLDPNNPILGEWQKIKMVLTDAQLLNTAKTKGAISDKEMELFANAAANDDLASLPTMMPVFNKLLKTINAEETSMVDVFKRIHNENPYDWEEVKSNINEVSLDNKQDKRELYNSLRESGLSIEEAKQKAGL